MMKIIIITLSLLILTACSSKPFVITQTDISVSDEQEVYIVDHGWHTGFVVPAKTIQKRLPQLKQRFPKTAYIEFGWGDKGFYQAEEITSGLTLQAIFWPTESVVHAVAIPEKPDIYFPNSQVESLCLNPNQYALLVNFIENSFDRNGDGEINLLKKGIYGNSQFYKGVGDYYLMNTCNKWTAKGLKSAGFDISTTFKLTASSIMDYLSEQRKSLPTRSCKMLPPNTLIAPELDGL